MSQEETNNPVIKFSPDALLANPQLLYPEVYEFLLELKKNSPEEFNELKMGDVVLLQQEQQKANLSGVTASKGDIFQAMSCTGNCTWICDGGVWVNTTNNCAGAGCGCYVGPEIACDPESPQLITCAIAPTTTTSTTTTTAAPTGSKNAYFSGGNTGAAVVTTDKLIYAADVVAAATSANLSVARYYLAGISDLINNGYAIGGTTAGADYSVVGNKLIYAIDASTAVTGLLATGAFYLTGLNGTNSKGYLLGGYTGAAVSTATKVTYSTDTSAAQTSANLTQSRYGASGLGNGTTKGYVCGGNTGAALANSYVNTTDLVTFSTDVTTAQTSVNLGTSRSYAWGINGDGTVGYVIGGATGSLVAVSTNEKITYATNTIASTGGLLTARYKLAGLSTGISVGYITGGSTGAGQTNETNKLNFSADIWTTVTSAYLTQARYGLIGVGQEGVLPYGGSQGYYSGGKNGDVTTTDKVVYTTDVTAAATTANLTYGRSYSSGVSDLNTKGYICGGQVINTVAGNIDKITYSTDTASSVTTFSFGSASAVGVNASTSKGYLAGGSTGVGGPVSTAYVVDYGTETKSTLGSTLVSAKYAPCGFGNNDTKGYVLGGSSGAVSTTADKITFATDVIASQTTANLSIPLWYQAGINGAGYKGYIAGGLTDGNTFNATTLYLTYATDTGGSVTTANLAYPRYALSGLSDGAVKGYFSGGVFNNGGFYTSVTNRLIFATEVADYPTTLYSLLLSQARYGLSGVGQEAYPGIGGMTTTTSTTTTSTTSTSTSSTTTPLTFGVTGYVCGGLTNLTTNVATTDKFNYALDTAAALTTSNLTRAKNGFAGVSNRVTEGYLIGGSTNTDSSGAIKSCDSIFYANDVTSATTTMDLPSTDYQCCGVSGSSDKGYVVGGSGPSAAAYKIWFANETSIAQTSANLSTARYNAVAVSDGYSKAYVAGGLTAIGGYSSVADKIVFSTDTTAAQTTANLTLDRSGLGGVAGLFNGYFAGGQTTGILSYTTQTDRVVFSTDTTASQTTANLSAARTFVSSLSNGYSKGYVSGGFSGFSDTALTDKITYSGDTCAAQTTANLSQARSYVAGVGNEIDYSNTLINNEGYHIGGVKGYVAGGRSSASYATSIDVVVYATDTTSVGVSGGLSVARQGNTGVTSGTVKCYFNGGSTGVVFYSTSDTVNFSTDVVSGRTTSALSSSRNAPGGVSDGYLFGYFAGGGTGSTSYVVTADKLTFSTDTLAAQTTANLSLAREGVGSISQALVKGYFCGGFTSSAPVATTDKLTFGNDVTSAATSANLTSIMSYPSGVDGGFNVGYILAGNNGSTQQSTAYKINYSNDSISTISSLPLARDSGAGVSQNVTVGYICGGQTSGGVATLSTNKLSFISDVSSSVASANVTTGRVLAGGAGQQGQFIRIFSGTKGYYGGGCTDTGPSNGNVASTYKMTFANDTFSAQTTANLTSTRDRSTGLTNGMTAGYFCGGDTGAYGAGVVVTADKLTYSTDTTAAKTSANLSSARAYAASLEVPAYKGYMLGGQTSYFGSFVVTTDKITYYNEITSACSSANLLSPNGGMGCVSDFTSKGFVVGGFDMATYSFATKGYKIYYANDIIGAQTSSNLGFGTYGIGSLNSGNYKGYFFGGETNFTFFITTTAALIIYYATETTSSLTTASLNVSRYEINNGITDAFSKGYVCGGNDTSSTPVVTVDKIIFSTDTRVTSTTDDLPVATGRGACVSQIILGNITNAQNMTMGYQ